MARILLIEDEKVTNVMISRMLGGMGFEVSTPDLADRSGYLETAKSLIRDESFVAGIFDLHIPDANGAGSVAAGLSLIKFAHQQQPTMKLLAFSGSVEPGAFESLRSIGVSRSYSKGTAEGIEELMEQLEKLKPR